MRETNITMLMSLSMVALMLINILPCYGENGTFTEAEKQFIANLHFYELPQALRFKMMGKKSGDRSNYCCSGTNFQETGWKTLSNVVSSYRTVNHAVSKGSESCGFLWAKRCSKGYYMKYSCYNFSIRCNGYKLVLLQVQGGGYNSFYSESASSVYMLDGNGQRLVTTTVYSRVKTYNRCPDEMVTCCNHYMNVSGNCLDEAEVQKYHGALQALFHQAPVIG